MSQTERWKMEASPIASRLKRCVTVREWRWWQLPLLLRMYVAAPPVGVLAIIAFTAAHTDWRLADLGKFLLLMCCGMFSVASTPRIMYATGGVTMDFSAVWVLPTAILLPPVYAALVPIPFYAILQMFVHRGVVHRTVFSAAAVSISYALASAVFRWFPHSFAGGSVGSGLHAFTWVVAVAVCDIVGGRVHHFMILGAVKLSDPRVKVWKMEWNREALTGLFAGIDLGVMITLGIALSPALVVLAVPTVLLVRRFLVYPVLVAQSRVDAKTGLLNISTWEREADAELSRAVRTRDPLSLAILDIDHFKRVNDTYGHLVGDKVLQAVAVALKAQSRDYDKVGRFGGEEFVLLLAQSDEDDALKIAERLRQHIGDMSVPIDERPDAPCVSITISIGVSAMERGEPRELTDLLTAADSALYRAKQAGRNRVCVSAPVLAGQLVAEIAGQMESVRADPAGTSLCPRRLLSAFVTER